MQVRVEKKNVEMGGCDLVDVIHEKFIETWQQLKCGKELISN
jgi:hypothetical protein